MATSLAMVGTMSGEAGCADQVVALTQRLGQRAGFLALNGYGRFERGPVPYIQVFRR